jgi:DinB family protein
MPRLLLIVSSLLLFGFLSADKTLSRKERKFAVNYLKETRDGLLRDVKNLSDTQMNFKISPQKWSIAQCIEHITIAEVTFMSAVNASLKSPPDPSRRNEIKVTDTTVIRVVTDRSHKSTAPEILQPHDKFPSTAAALQEFISERNKSIEFIKSTDADLRDRYAPQPHPILGVLDIYQLVVQMAAHSRRHTLQIEEVMADPNFPKN